MNCTPSPGLWTPARKPLALQTNHNHAGAVRVGRIFTAHDRAGESILSNRLGLTHDAIEVPATTSTSGATSTPLTPRAGGSPTTSSAARRSSTPRSRSTRRPRSSWLKIDVFTFGILTDFTQRALPGQRPAGLAHDEPDAGAAGRGAVLVRQRATPARAHREARRDGGRRAR